VSSSWFLRLLRLSRDSLVPRDIFARPVPRKDFQPYSALLVLTSLNLLNYADRSVLFAVQKLVQEDFHLSFRQVGFLTSAFLGFYMVAAPFVGPLADRYSRKLIIFLGAIFWSGLALKLIFPSRGAPVRAPTAA